MNRSLKLSMLLVAALGSGQAMALQLGQIKVKSALGQPLLAEIPVTPEGAGDLRNLRAQLASSEDFARAGITDGRAQVPLRFAIVNGPGSTKLIRITSAQAINDPFLDLLVEVDNANGKSVREFTILLDPPGRRSDSPALIAAPSSSSSQSRRSIEPQAAQPAAAPTRRSDKPRAAPVSNGNYGPVESGDTLSGIARKVSPNGVELNQMLLALKQSNPDAFYRDNVNALKRGAILRVPTAEQARAMSASAALAEVRRQNGDWRAQTVSAPTRLADAATGPDDAASSKAAGDGNDHLVLVPSEDAGKHAGADSAGNSKGAAGDQQSQQRNQENVASLQQQGVEQKSRINDLQDINSKNARLLALKDNEIADLQQKLAQARKAAGMLALATQAPASGTSAAAPEAAASAAAMPTAASSVATAASSLAPMSAAAASSTAAASASSSPASVVAWTPARPAVATSVATAQPAAQPRPVPVAVAQPWYMRVWVWSAGAVVIVLLLLLGLRGGRREPAKRAAGGSLADRFGSSRPVAPSDERHSELLDADQEELMDQLSEHPDDVGLHLELVSLYYHRRDVERFESAAEAMYAHVTDQEQTEWQDVVAMGADLAPSHPLFGGSTDPVSDEEIDDEIDEREALHEFDLDAYAVSEDSEESGNDALEAERDSSLDVPPAHGTVSEYHFDYNLTYPGREQRPSPLADPSEVSESSTYDVHVDPLAVDESTRLGEQKHEDERDWALDRENDESFLLTDAEPASPAGPSSVFSASGPFEPDAPAELGEFSDDPVDTKLDLARAYLDMGDGEGARAMLGEVMTEGSQMQRDVARDLLQKLA